MGYYGEYDPDTEYNSPMTWERIRSGLKGCMANITEEEHKAIYQKLKERSKQLQGEADNA